MEKVYVFGSGNNAFGVIDFLGEENVISVIDNEKKKCGKRIRGIEIISFDCFLTNYKGEKIIISTAMYDEIVLQLRNNNINNFEIAPLIIMGISNIEKIVDELTSSNIADIFILGKNIISDRIEELFKEYESGIIINYINDLKDIKNAEGKIIIICEENINLDNVNELKTYAKKCYDIYQDRVNNPKMEQFKNIGNGKKCFIVGNGPSLKLSDLEKIQEKGFDTFGMNLIYKIYDHTVWRPTYYVLTDYNIYCTYYDELVKISNDKTFIKNFYSCKGTPDIKNVNYYNGYGRRSYYENQLFSQDVSKIVYSGYTVMYDCIQLALYMGYDEVYLIGADFTVKNDAAQQGNHVYDAYHKDKRDVAGRSYIDATFCAMEKAKEIYSNNNRTIYNATRGGQLEVFSRVNIDSLID